jgi:hypothetical protein
MTMSKASIRDPRSLAQNGQIGGARLAVQPAGPGTPNGGDARLLDVEAGSLTVTEAEVLSGHLAGEGLVVAASVA